MEGGEEERREGEWREEGHGDEVKDILCSDAEHLPSVFSGGPQTQIF